MKSQENTEVPDVPRSMDRPLFLHETSTSTSKRTELCNQTKLQLQIFSKTSITETGAKTEDNLSWLLRHPKMLMSLAQNPTSMHIKETHRLG